jgi:transcriptional regulator with XRE-family HTH domain
MTQKAPQQRIYLREWRQYRNLTQDQLADRIGISRVMVSKIERGLNPYHQAFLEAAAEALACEPADLLVRDPSKPEAIWSVWESIPPMVRPQAIAIITTFMGAKTGT